MRLEKSMLFSFICPLCSIATIVGIARNGKATFDSLKYAPTTSAAENSHEFLDSKIDVSLL